MLPKPILLLIAVPLVTFSLTALADEAAVERNPRVILIYREQHEPSLQELSRLQAPRGIFAGMRAMGWEIGESPSSHVQLLRERDAGQLIEAAGIKEFPAVFCLEDGEIVRSFRQGCSTPLDGYTFGWLLKGVMERPTPAIDTTITVPTSGSYPLRGNHWNFEGHWNPGHDFMVQHLRGPNHAGLFPASWPIERWSDEELRALHDDLHEMNRPRWPLDSQLEPGNAVRPGEVVPIYRPPVSSNYSSTASSGSSNKPSSTARPSGSSALSSGSSSRSSSSSGSGRGFF